MKYGRRLKGPILVTPKQFNKAIQGTGIGIKVDQCRDLLRVPERGEDQHFEIIGDTGSGKTTIIMQMLRQIQARKHSAIIYDPACEFIERFYSEARGDIVLNPLDRRCPYWGPSEELVRRAEARTIAASLFQPTNDKKGEFFVESPQKIFAHLLLDLPTPHQLVDWMSHPEEIDRRIKDTELASLIDPLGSATTIGRARFSQPHCRQLPAAAAERRCSRGMDGAGVVERPQRLDLYYIAAGRARSLAPSAQPLDRHARSAPAERTET